MHGKSGHRANGFISRYGLWNEEQQLLAHELVARAEAEELHLIRLCWSDSHGHVRAKAVTLTAFKTALNSGHNVNVATWTLDASGARVFKSFTGGGGMGLPEMTGSPNLVIVPDPSTFRVLPWAPGIGWIICDEYFTDGTPFHFSARQVLRRALARLANSGLTAIVGLEVEWYLLRLVDGTLQEANIATGGERGQPLRTTPPEPGFSYHSESNMDLMQPMLSALAKDYLALDLGLRSVENEWGAGQIECTFQENNALKAADDYILFRSATRQICRRHNHLASFMAVPGRRGLYPSGWHLHLSLSEPATGSNIMMPDVAGELLSPTGRSFVAGLLDNAAATIVFASPTINGFRRFRANSLAPDRVTWGFDYRGTMVRVLGGPGDSATRIENRVGEPAANPYLHIAAQIAAGLDGLHRNAEPGPTDEDPYQADRPMLPTSLSEALGALDGSSVLREAFGGIYIDYYLQLKRAELTRYEAFVAGSGGIQPDQVTDWETNEYFDFF